jgi:pimeloyl-ACP methyl ester carboxylesterase
MDLPGHGDSSHSTDPDANYNVLFYGEVLAELIKETNVKNVVLVGHSLGANAVIEALPLIKNCNGCVLLGASLVHSAADVAATFLPNPAVSFFFSADYTEDNVKSFAAAVCSKSDSVLPDFIAEDFKKTDKNCRVYLAKSVGENKLSDELDVLKKSEIPVLLAVGVDDQLISKEYLKNVDLTKWKHQVFEIPKAGHCAQFENANDFNSIVSTFCQSL